MSVESSFYMHLCICYIYWVSWQGAGGSLHFAFLIEVRYILVLAGDVGSDHRAVRGLGECSCSGRAAHLLPAAFWPPGQDLPEGLYLSVTSHNVLVINAHETTKLIVFNFSSARLPTVWGNALLLQTSLRPPSLWMESCLSWIQDTANLRYCKASFTLCIYFFTL